MHRAELHLTTAKLAGIVALAKSPPLASKDVAAFLDPSRTAPGGLVELFDSASGVWKATRLASTSLRGVDAVDRRSSRAPPPSRRRRSRRTPERPRLPLVGRPRRTPPTQRRNVVSRRDTEVFLNRSGHFQTGHARSALVPTSPSATSSEPFATPLGPASEMPQQHRSALALLLVVSTGCVTVTGTSRGDFLERERIEHDVRGARPIGSVEDGRAQLILPAEECSTWLDLYRELEHQEVTHPSYVRLFVGAGLAGLGIPLALYGAENADIMEQGNPGTAALVFGIPLALVGTLMFVGSPFGGETEHRTVETERTQPEYEHKCVDVSQPKREPVSWTLSLGEARRAGVTGPDGVLALAPVAGELLAQVPADPAARRLATGGSLALELKFAESPFATSYELRAGEVPAAQWTRWSNQTMTKLTPDESLRLDGCRDATPDAAAALRCLWSDTTPSGFRELSGALTRTESGDYATLLEIAGTRGEAFVFRTLLPAPNADWLVQVVDLQTGAVVVESFSSTSRRHDVSGVFPRTGDFAIVLNAERSGSFRSNLTVKR